MLEHQLHLCNSIMPDAVKYIGLLRFKNILSFAITKKFFLFAETITAVVFRLYISCLFHLLKNTVAA